MSINFKEVETTGIETSPVAEVLAGLRANESRYFWNKYKQEFVVYTPEEKPEILPFIEKVLAERDMVFPYSPLNVAQLEVDGILWFMIMAWLSMSSIHLKKEANELSDSNCQTALTLLRNLKVNLSLPANAPNWQAKSVAPSLLPRASIYRMANLGKPRFFK